MRICIDAGHGGVDSGASHKNTEEKDIVLDIAFELRNILDYWGYETVMIREEDEYIGLSERAWKANYSKADMFISIHTNAFSNPSAEGIETYYYSSSEEGEKLAREVQSSLIKNLRRYDRGIKTAKYTVLERTIMTAILAEVGFISNKEESALMKNEYIKFLKAYSIADGIENYLS